MRTAVNRCGIAIFGDKTKIPFPINKPRKQCRWGLHSDAILRVGMGRVGCGLAALGGFPRHDQSNDQSIKSQYFSKDQNKYHSHVQPETNIPVKP